MDALAKLREISGDRDVDERVADTIAAAESLVGEDGDLELERRLVESVASAPGGLDEVCRHLIDAGGKRIRPVICLLAFRTVRGDPPLPLDLAVCCELLHNATLLHDDVIDEGDTRRGRPACRAVWSNAISILGGDFLLMRCVELVSERGKRFMDPFVETIRRLVEGEITQLGLRGSIATSEEQYFRIVEGKTASLFGWSALSGAMAAGAAGAACEAIGEFGRRVGVAFQLVDDALDLTADSAHTGKTLLADIGQGKLTLPVILAAEESPELRRLLAELVDGGDAPAIAREVSRRVDESGALAEVRDRAARQTGLALDALERLRRLDGCRPLMVEMLSEMSRRLLDRGR
ncbi:MAG: polyprenyl synthetase family protein [Polyangia bacterium]